MEIKFSPGEKLILLMLCELYEHLKVNGQTDIKLIQQAIYSGDLWALDWEMTGVFHDYERPLPVVRETVDILLMWERLEQSFADLKPAQTEWLAKNVEPFSGKAHFPGFDGNNETDYVGAARFLVNQLGRFSYFKGRDFDAHHPTLDGHRRMWKVFDPILHQVANHNLDEKQIAEVLKVWWQK